MLSAGRIGDKWQKRCNTPIQGTGSPTAFAQGQALGRLGDKTIPYEEIVPCPKCCQTYTAPVITGSSKVFVNGLSALRVSDLALGLSGNFPLFQGSPKVFMS